MKKNVYKYLCLASTLIVSVLMFSKWFTVDLMVGVEKHSFLTIPDLVNAGVGFLKEVGGSTVAFSVLLLAGVLEYFSILASVLGIWGIIRSLMKKTKSRLIFVSQCTTLSLVVIAIIALVIIDIVSSSVLGGVMTVFPTVWFVLTALFLTASLVSGSLFARMLEEDEEENI